MMFWQAVPLVLVLAGLVLYTVLAGADFGAGFWQLLGGLGGAEAARVREHAHRSMAPVWEANHVWLIFVLVVFWTAYPVAFGSIASTLAVPLFIGALGIIFRGAAYAFRAGAREGKELQRTDLVFAVSSILTPFSFGTVIGAVTTNRVPEGNAAGALFSSWLNPPSIFLGVLAVVSCAYLAAIYLAADAADLGESDLERDFRRRALWAGVIAGAVSTAGLFVIDADDHGLFDALLTLPALVPVVGTFAAGLGTLALVARHRLAAARFLSATAVAGVVCAWAFARWPTILPKLTVYQAAAGRPVLVWLIVAVCGGGALVAPSLVVLFRLTLSGRFRASPRARADAAPGRLPEVPLPAAIAACVTGLLAGVGLLNFASPDWAHAVGVICFLVVIGLGSFVVTTTTLSNLTTNQPPLEGPLPSERAGRPEPHG